MQSSAKVQPLFLVQGAQAIADVILGKVSPSARLPMSFYYSNYTRQARPAAHSTAIRCGVLVTSPYSLREQIAGSASGHLA